MHPTPLSPKQRDRASSAGFTTLARIGDVVQESPVLPVAPRRLVVLKSCCLGDVLLATPLLAALRRAYSRAHLVAGVGRWARPALLNNPDLDGLLDLETVGLGPLRPTAAARVARRLRAGRF